MSEATRVLGSIAQGDAKAADELLTPAHEELRRLAAHKMTNEPPGQTLCVFQGRARDVAPTVQ